MSIEPRDLSLRVEHRSDRVAILRVGHNEPLVVQHAVPEARPYLHPILAPDGNGILTEDMPAHHPWQHGLYVGLNDVNGVGFWTEGLRKDPMDGTFHPEPLEAPSVAGNQARWVVETVWRGPDGNAMLTETQCWMLHDHGTSYELDLEWSLVAATTLKFGQSAYGGLFLRMPYDPERGGEVINSEGQAGAAAEGQRARWVAVSIPIDGRSDWAGIAVFDHVANPEHPVPWRVDGQLGVAPSRSITGAWDLRQGETAHAKYRLFIFCGQTDVEHVEAHWRTFNGEAGSCKA